MLCSSASRSAVALCRARFICLLFRGSGFIPSLGMVIVLQNIVSSLFNSHLFDFFHGWLYVFGVGIVGGMVLRAKDEPPGRQVPP